jgi:hypothetical protein
MPHTPGHTDGITPNGENQTQTSYKIAGTNEPYTGLTVNIGGFIYTTVGGGIEGDRQQVVPIGNGNNTQTQNNNPVTRLFQAPSSPRYRRSDNNRLIRIGANLHEHQDGTIMTEHSMGPNDNSVVVNVVSQTGGTNGTRTRTRTQARTQTRRTQTSGGGMGGGRTGGGY